MKKFLDLNERARAIFKLMWHRCHLRRSMSHREWIRSEEPRLANAGEGDKRTRNARDKSASALIFEKDLDLSRKAPCRLLDVDSLMSEYSLLLWFTNGSRKRRLALGSLTCTMRARARAESQRQRRKGFHAAWRRRKAWRRTWHAA